MNESRPVDDLANLVPNDWKQNPSFKTARFRFFPTAIAIGSPQAESVRKLFPLIDKIANHPVSFAILKLGEGTKFRSISSEIFYAEGHRHVSVLAGERSMLPGEYMTIFSPVPSTSTGSDETACENAINVCRGLLTSLFGHSAADAAAYSCDSYLHEVRTTLSAPTIENFPHPSEYSFVEGTQIAALVERVTTHIDRGLQRRLETALFLIGSTAAIVDPAIRLVNTWIALEVACGTRGKAEQAVKLTTKDDGTYMRLKTARDEFFHKGLRRGLKTDDERVVHAALMNILLQHYRLPTTVVAPIRTKESKETTSDAGKDNQQ